MQVCNFSFSSQVRFFTFLCYFQILQSYFLNGSMLTLVTICEGQKIKINRTLAQLPKKCLEQFWMFCGIRNKKNAQICPVFSCYHYLWSLIYLRSTISGVSMLNFTVTWSTTDIQHHLVSIVFKNITLLKPHQVAQHSLVLLMSIILKAYFSIYFICK